ncbi:class I SAM-dependent methyltransferase [Raoultella terrigena]|uniref:class I SAM-dependent methyltransferase n=1 Tax=Raoultella terrigena TaxID=577 RepID=UPI001F445FF8
MPATNSPHVCSLPRWEDVPARVLVVGAGGTAGEIIAAAALEPQWSFVAVDPSPPMLELARSAIAEADLTDRVATVPGVVVDLAAAPLFDAGIMIGVLHHLAGDAEKLNILQQIAARLKPDAPLVGAGNYRPYASQPLLMKAWENRWKMSGAGVEERRAKMDKILQGAQPPQSEEAVMSLLAGAGFDQTVRFFSSLFWGAWLARRLPETT